jgi:hypothetical protein
LQSEVAFCHKLSSEVKGLADREAEQDQNLAATIMYVTAESIYHHLLVRHIGLWKKHPTMMAMAHVDDYRWSRCLRNTLSLAVERGAWDQVVARRLVTEIKQSLDEPGGVWAQGRRRRTDPPSDPVTVANQRALWLGEELLMTVEELQRLPAATPWESYNWLNRPYNEIIVRFTDDVSDDDLAAKVVEVRRRLRPEAASPSLARRPRGGESDYKRHVALHRLWCDFCTAHPELDPESDTTRDVFISAIRRRKIDASTVWPAHEGEPKVPAWTAARDML